MNSKPFSARVRSLLENRLAYFLLALVVWLVGVTSGSAAVLVASSVVVYALPFLYVAALKGEENAARKEIRRDKPRSERISLTQPYFKQTSAIGGGMSGSSALASLSACAMLSGTR